MQSENLEKVSHKVAKAYYDVYGNALEKVILYGSYARGEETAESDMDFAAVVKGERLALQRKINDVIDLLVDTNLENDVVIAPVVIPYSEFECYKEKLPYYRNIAEEGVIVG